MSKRKKPDDEHRELCNRVLRVLAELPLDVLEKIAFELSFINAEKALPDILKTKLRSDSQCVSRDQGPSSPRLRSASRLFSSHCHISDKYLKSNSLFT